jgi:hypothetical protein
MAQGAGEVAVDKFDGKLWQRVKVVRGPHAGRAGSVVGLRADGSAWVRLDSNIHPIFETILTHVAQIRVPDPVLYPEDCEPAR